MVMDDVIWHRRMRARVDVQSFCLVAWLSTWLSRQVDGNYRSESELDFEVSPLGLEPRTG